MSKKFRLLMVLVLVTGLLGGLMTASTVSADPQPSCVIELPRLDLEDGWDTKIQVQNVGGVAGGAVVFFWPPWDGTCPSNDPGPMGHACMQLPYNGVWTLHTQIPDGAQSAIVYSVDADDFQDCCEDAGDAEGSTAAWKAWKEDCACNGPPLAVTVDRWGPDYYDGEFEISSSYTGIADPEMVGPGPPYKYFVPYVMHGYCGELDTTITIQNSGQQCTSCWIYYKEEGNCEYMKAQKIEAIAPGQSVKKGPGADAEMAFPTPELNAPWLGSAYITCNQPMAILVDQLSHPPSENRGTMVSLRGMPYKRDWDDVEEEWVEWDRTWYADLLYREVSGWSSSIQVQNLTQHSMPTFVTVEFFDQSGDSIFFVGDWICRNGAKTFYLPAIIDFAVNYPFGYVGAAEIQSHQQVDYPGYWHPSGEPIFAVVDLKKTKRWDEGLGKWRHTVPGEEQAGAYNAHPLHEKENAWGWAMPYIAKEQDGVTSRIVIRNNANCSKIRGKVLIKDETGTQVAMIDVNWLHPKHIKVIDLAYFGHIYRGFQGAAEFLVGAYVWDPVAEEWVWDWGGGVEDLCDVDSDGRVDKLPIMPSVVVLNYGWVYELLDPHDLPEWPPPEGDLTRVYEGIPFAYGPRGCNIEICGQVIEELDLEPIMGAEISTVVEGANAPYTVKGFAYVGPHWCGQVDEYDDPDFPARLEGATVKLQQYKTVSGVTGWYEVGSATTTGGGWFQFEDKLAYDGEYRLKIFVEVGFNTVSYLSAPWTAEGPAVTYFYIDWEAPFLEINDAGWCGVTQTPDEVETLQATTDSTGHYCFDYEKTAEKEDIVLKAFKTGHVARYLTVLGVECDDQMVNFELDPDCDTVKIKAHVEDKMTGLPIKGATVTASGKKCTTGAAGSCTIANVPFDPDNPIIVTASKKDYNPVSDTVYIPECGGTAEITFQLHQEPKAKALLYYGNGGIGGPTDVISYSHMAAYLEHLGKTVVYTETWPTQFDWTLKYELIVLLGPGHDSFSVTAPYTEDLSLHGFTVGQKADLDRFMQQDGKLVVLSDATAFTGVDVENDLISDTVSLPAQLQFDLANFTSGHGDQVTAGQCLVGNIQTYTADAAGNNWTSIQASVLGAIPGDLILQNAGANPATSGPDEEMYGVDVSSHGNGWVAILGDMHGLSDAAWMSNWNWSADNEWVIFNWLVCDP